MRSKIFILQGMADEALPDLGGRSPLESAKTPVLDRLAQNGRIGTASFCSRGLEAEPWVALFSVLGYDPAEHYTGPAPLEALGAKLELNDREIVFLCDFVSELDGALVDAAAGHITDREARTLLKDVEKKLHDAKARFKSVHGYRNLFVVDDPALAENLDDTTTLSPNRCVGERLERRGPQGKGAEFLSAAMQSARSVLEPHEINRVRIDLGENPANRIWLWGQGRAPKLPPFSDRFKGKAGLASSALFAQGLARAAGMHAEKSSDKILDADIQFVYTETGVAQSSEPLKVKVRAIEKFDQWVGAQLEASGPETRVLVASDLVYSIPSKAYRADPVPFLISGAGIEAENRDKFTEKNCGLSRHTFEKGYRLLESFLR